MIKIIIVIAFVMLPHIAFAGEWVLWQCEFISGTNTNQPIPLTEHKTLKACQASSAQMADYIFSWAKKNESVKTESVTRSIRPDGAFYKENTGYSVRTEYRCYPHSFVPVQENFINITPNQ